MYHKVDVIAPTVWWVSAKTFAKQLSALERRDVVYLADYDPNSANQCVITFDDAYENIYRHALPILKEKQYPFEVFVNGDLLGRWNKADISEPLTRYCDRQQLRELAGGGGRIQWHTRSHPNLTTLCEADIDHQLSIPEDLRRDFPEPHLTWFAYPFGAHTPAAVEMVKRRFQGAVSVLAGNDADRFQLNRVVASEHWLPAGMQHCEGQRNGSAESRRGVRRYAVRCRELARRSLLYLCRVGRGVKP